MSQLETDLRARLAALDLPGVPPTLDAALLGVVAAPRPDRRPLPLLAVALVAAVAVALAGLVLMRPIATGPIGSAIFPTEVDGLHVYAVDELLTARAAGHAPAGPYALAGYWSYAPRLVLCAAPLETPGELELYCHEHDFGVTKLRETVSDDAAFANGTALAPYVPADLAGPVREMFDATRSAQPAPIVVVGHFDDARAADCRPEARQLCLDRFVIDAVKLFALDASSPPVSAPTGSQPPAEKTGVAPPSVGPSPSVEPSSSDAAGYAFPAEVDGLRVYTVGELLAGRKAGQVSGGTIALAGYWSWVDLVHSCAAPQSTPGVLEIYCRDGEFGITELDEPIMIVHQIGNETMTESGTSGPKLTPYLSNDLARQVLLAPVHGQPYPPVPIVVIGHLDDSRAALCQAAARQRCRDRFVVDQIVTFDVAAVPSPGITPVPTPYQPSPSESPLFDPASCTTSAQGKPNALSFAGWMDGGDLHLTSGQSFAGVTVYAAITKRAVPLGEWTTLPGASRESLAMGRLVCYAFGGMPPNQGMAFDSVAGTYYRLYRDGSTARPTAAP